MSNLNIIIFVALGILFDAYILILLLRFFLNLFIADYYNPLSHYIYNLTQWFVRPWQRFLATRYKIDFAVLLTIIIFEVIKINLLVWLRFDRLPQWQGLPIWVAAEIFNQVINLYFYALIIRVILSWIGTSTESSFFQIVIFITEPLLRPLRRVIPIINGFDFSAIFLALLLKSIGVFLVSPLIRWGELHSLSFLLPTS